MIDFSSQNDFQLRDAESKKAWVMAVILSENKLLGELEYVFCSDSFLHKINVDYLNHDTLTDIITFDYTEGDVIAGEIYISTDRVKENAESLNLDFMDELDRVVIHGVLHLCGYGDKTREEEKEMRLKEDRCLLLRGGGI